MRKCFRLRKRLDFSKVYGTGRSAAGRLLVVYSLPIDTGELRIGFSAGKKMGTAVVRNRVKRRLKEVVRRRLGELQRGHYLVVIARSGAIKATIIDLDKEFIYLARRLRIWCG